MKDRKWKIFVALVSLMSVGVARAEVLYHELFTVKTNEVNDTMPEHGWEGHEGTNGIAWTYPSISGFGGTAWDGGPVNSSPLNLTNGDKGFFYGYAHTDQASLLTTEKHSFEMVSWTNLQFSMRHTSTRADAVRAAIKVDGSWYVSDAVTIQANAGWAGTLMWIVDATNTTWYALDFTPSVTMTIGASTALPATGIAESFGFYIDAQTAGVIRYDNFKITGDAILGAKELSIRYQELWSNDGSNGNTLFFDTAPYGWRQYALHGGTDWKNIGDDCVVAGEAGGAAIPPGGSINSDPLYPDGSNGYVYSLAWQSVSREQIIFQDEYTWDVADLSRTSFRWEYKNALNYQKYRALIAVAPTDLDPSWDIDDVTWYATEVLVTTSIAEDWRYTAELDLGSAAWNNVNITEGSDISIGSATNAPTSGYVVGSGIYIEGKIGDHRFDDFAISVLQAGPPPEIGNVLVENLGVNELALTWTTTNGYNYTLWEKSDLISSAWSTNQFGIPGGASSVTVTTSVDAVQAFYKVTSE